LPLPPEVPLRRSGVTRNRPRSPCIGWARQNVYGELDPRPGIREQPRPKADMDWQYANNPSSVTRSSGRSRSLDRGNLANFLVVPPRTSFAVAARSYGRTGS
jgi:hypothetical protein